MTSSSAALLARFRPAPRQRHPLFALGAAGVDTPLGGGLARGAVHEIYAANGAAAPAATGFAIGTTIRAAAGGPILWIRHEALDGEVGALHPQGFAALGLDPPRLTLARARTVEAVLHAAGEAAKCPALGAVLIDLWGEARRLDLSNSRRLALAADTSGVPVLVLRMMAAPVPSAASTRWSVAPLASRALPANAPGAPAFAVTLLRHRGGVAGREWQLEWNHEHECFDDFAAATPLSCTVVPAARDRQAAARTTAEPRLQSRRLAG